MAKYFEQKGQILKAAKCLELSTNYEELDLLLLQQGINPGLYSPQSDQNIYTSPPALPDLKMNIKPPSLSQIKLGFGERPFSQRINNQEINPANADNLGQ